ncbi:unnamed protein product [Prunus armeniaca]|uniref:Uncharacterized protein n=1 Tax=Prunus armeniaca TaxID=36596 RepID=A0A6J5U6F3_PRUAR|nr:unnamed protein product [Prunus armeniaca]
MKKRRKNGRNPEEEEEDKVIAMAFLSKIGNILRRLQTSIADLNYLLSNCLSRHTHPSISRFHLQILSNPSSQQLSLTDLSSEPRNLCASCSSWTYWVNWGFWLQCMALGFPRLEPGVRVELREGDILRVGGSSRDEDETAGVVQQQSELVHISEKPQSFWVLEVFWVNWRWRWSFGMQPQVPKQGQSLSMPLPANQSQPRQQLLSQNIQNNIPAAGVQSSAGLSSALPPSSGLTQTPIPSIVGQNQNMQNMGQGVPSNMFATSQRQLPGRQQVVPKHAAVTISNYSSAIS